MPPVANARGVLRGIATRPAKRAPMVLRESALVIPAAGIDGDFGRRRGRAQLTVLDAQAWRAAQDELGAQLPWTLRRANLLVSGLPLQPLAGARLRIGAVTLEVTGETDPCRRMDDAHPGLRRALAVSARGGVRCRIVAGGSIALGDPVTWEPAMTDLFGTSPPTGARTAGRV